MDVYLICADFLICSRAWLFGAYSTIKTWCIFAPKTNLSITIITMIIILKKYPHNLLNDCKIWASRNNTHKRNDLSWDSNIIIHIIHITTEKSVAKFIKFLQTHTKLSYRQNVGWLHGLCYLGWYRIYSASSEICTQFVIFLSFWGLVRICMHIFFKVTVKPLV